MNKSSRDASPQFCAKYALRSTSVHFFTIYKRWGENSTERLKCIEMKLLDVYWNNAEILYWYELNIVRCQAAEKEIGIVSICE